MSVSVIAPSCNKNSSKAERTKEYQSSTISSSQKSPEQIYLIAKEIAENLSNSSVNNFTQDSLDFYLDKYGFESNLTIGDVVAFYQHVTDVSSSTEEKINALEGVSFTSKSVMTDIYTNASSMSKSDYKQYLNDLLVNVASLEVNANEKEFLIQSIRNANLIIDDNSYGEKGSFTTLGLTKGAEVTLGCMLIGGALGLVIGGPGGFVVGAGLGFVVGTIICLGNGK